MPSVQVGDAEVPGEHGAGPVIVGVTTSPRVVCSPTRQAQQREQGVDGLRIQARFLRAGPFSFLSTTDRRDWVGCSAGGHRVVTWNSTCSGRARCPVQPWAMLHGGLVLGCLLLLPGWTGIAPVLTLWSQRVTLPHFTFCIKD